MYQLPIVAPGYGEEPPREEDLSRCLSNTCVIDKAVLTEALRGALDRPFFRILRIGEPLLIALCLGLLIWTLAARRGTGPAVLLGFVLVSVCLLYWLQFIRYPKKSVHDQLVKQAVEDGTLELENRLYFTQENVANRRGKRRDTLHMGYDKIKRVFETPRLIVLTTRRNRLIPLDKAGFANGGPEELYRLLTRKCPKLKTKGRSAHDPSR